MASAATFRSDVHLDDLDEQYVTYLGLVNLKNRLIAEVHRPNIERFWLDAYNRRIEAIDRVINKLVETRK